jgi:hypothetical protein
MKQRINNIFTAVLLLGISVAAAGCNTPAATAYTKISPAVTSKETTTGTAAGKQLATDAPSGTVCFTFPDQGNIRVDGRGHFSYQRVFTPITEATIYQGVTFTPFTYGPGTTITAPIGYWFTVTFADGSTEELQYVGLGQTDNFSINITKHDNPAAGVMLGWQDVGGGLTPCLYLLVSE